MPQDGSFHVPKDEVCGSPSGGVELLLKDLSKDPYFIGSTRTGLTHPRVLKKELLKGPTQ